MRYNRTNFVSNGFALRVLRAMWETLNTGFAHYVDNRRGQRWLRVDVVRVDGSYTFQFLADNGQDVGALILQALFVWNDENEQEFSRMLSELYTASAHPLVSVRRSEAHAEAESNTPEVKKPWKSALKDALGYLTAIAVGGAAGHAYVAMGMFQ